MEAISQEILIYWGDNISPVSIKDFADFGNVDFIEKIGFPLFEEWSFPILDLALYHPVVLQHLEFNDADYICFSELAGNLYLINKHGEVWSYNESNKSFLFCNTDIEKFCYFVTKIHQLYNDDANEIGREEFIHKKLSQRPLLKSIDPPALSDNYSCFWDLVFLEEF